MELVQDALQISSMAEDSTYSASWVDEVVTGFMSSTRHITKRCKGRAWAWWLSHRSSISTAATPFSCPDAANSLMKIENKNWTLNGVQEVVRLVIDEQNTLFDAMIKNFELYDDLYRFIYELLNRALMFCFLKRQDDKQLVMHNRIFEIVISKCTVFPEGQIT
jgi:hypothetical protein